MSTPSQEQEAVVAVHPVKGAAAPFILVEATPGSGKTTLIRHYAEAHKRRILYLVFNSANAVEARSKLPAWVTATTIHALAFEAKGQSLKHKLRDAGITVKDIQEHVRRYADDETARFVRDTLTAFCISGDSAIGMQHVPEMCADPLDTLIFAAEYWGYAKSKHHPAPISHEIYLKLWALESPLLAQFDLIVLDEGQDSDAAAVAFIRRHHAAGIPVLVAGDRHQAIYAWRGAHNAMQEFAPLATHTFGLTQSFRLNAETAHFANRIIFESVGAEPGIVGANLSPKPPEQTRAYIARYNATLIGKAAQALIREPGLRIHFAGTSPNDGFNPRSAYSFQLIEDIAHLKAGNLAKISSREVARRRSWDAFTNWVISTGKREYSTAIKLVSTRTPAQVFALLAQLVKAAAGPTEAALTLSTAHRAKGLEWDDVLVLDDFPQCFPMPGRMFQELDPDSQEPNLLYVAVTRARHKCDFADPILRFHLRREAPSPLPLAA